jgi:hypothetical protein
VCLLVLFFRKSVFTGTGSSALTRPGVYVQAVLRTAAGLQENCWRVEWRLERDVDAENSAGVDVTLTSSLLVVLQGPPARWAMRRVTAAGPAQEVVARVPAESSSALTRYGARVLHVSTYARHGRAIAHRTLAASA